VIVHVGASRWAGIDCGECLEPYRPLNEEEQRQLRLALNQWQESGETEESAERE